MSKEDIKENYNYINSKPEVDCLNDIYEVEYEAFYIDDILMPKNVYGVKEESLEKVV